MSRFSMSRSMIHVVVVFMAVVMGSHAVTAQPAAAPQPAGQQTQMTGKEALNRASWAKKYLYVFFYKQGGSIAGLFGKDTTAQTNSMKSVFDTATQKLAGKADAVAVNVTDPKEKEIVQQYDVSRAPMPLVLAIAPNGAVTGGFPGKFSEEQLLNAMTTPGMEKCLKYLQDKKLVFVCFQGANTKSNEAAMKGVMEFKADPKFGQAAEIVKIDPSDKEEAKTLADLKVSPKTEEAVTVFLAPPGVPIGTYKGSTDKKTIVTQLTSAISSCGSGCGPSGCGPAAK